MGNDRYIVSDVENCQLTQMPYENTIDSSRMKLWLEHIKKSDEMDGGNTVELSDTQMSDEYCMNFENLEDGQTPEDEQMPEDQIEIFQ